jgi:hypothetical protein
MRCVTGVVDIRERARRPTRTGETSALPRAQGSGQFERVIQFPAGKQIRYRGARAAMEFQLQLLVEINP